MNIIFLGSLFSNDRKEEIVSNSIGPIANANNALQHALVKGFSLCNDGKRIDLTLLNMPNIGAYPLKYKEVNWTGSNFNIYGYEGINIPFLNLVQIKHYIKYRNLKKALRKLLEIVGSDVWVVVYDLYEPFLHALFELRKKYTYKVCVIVPDLIGFTGEPKNLLFDILAKNKKNKVDLYLSCADSYVLLCERMNEKLPIQNKPYVVVEGIFDCGDRNKKNIIMSKHRDVTNVLLYSGAVDRRNGILILLEAFSLIKQSNYKLIICGDGSDKDSVIAAQHKDSRIEYKGQISRETILELQREATLLINPRQPLEDFTKYSFPSKMMEYLASAIPVLTYKLLGIPEEYFQYCYVIEDMSTVALSDKIVEICCMDNEILLEKGRRAQNFILEKKNPQAQVSRILDMLSNNNLYV